MHKKQIGLRIEAHLKDGLDDQAHRTGIPATTLLEEYITKGWLVTPVNSLNRTAYPLFGRS